MNKVNCPETNYELKIKAQVIRYELNLIRERIETWPLRANGRPLSVHLAYVAGSNGD